MENRIRYIKAFFIMFIVVIPLTVFAGEKWADAPAKLTTDEFLDLAFKKFIIPENMRYVDIKFYPGNSPENAFVFVEQGWTEGQSQKRINRLSNRYSKVFDEYVFEF